MEQILTIANVKCQGCADNIKQQLTEINGISAIEVDVEHGEVSFDLAESSLPLVEKKLSAIGYPVI